MKTASLSLLAIAAVTALAGCVDRRSPTCDLGRPALLPDPPPPRPLPPASKVDGGCGSRTRAECEGTRGCLVVKVGECEYACRAAVNECEKLSLEECERNPRCERFAGKCYCPAGGKCVCACGPPSACRMASTRSARVMVGKIVFEGTINKEAAARTVGLGTPALLACYRRALEQDSKLSGKTILELAINSLGRVGEVKVGATRIGGARGLHRGRGMAKIGEELASCIEGEVKRWRFPPAEASGARIVVSLLLSTGR